MRGAYRAACVVLLAAAPLWAAPPDVPVGVKAKPGQLVRIVVKGEAELGTLKNFTDSEAFWGELVGPKGQRHFVFQAPADGTKAEYVIGWWAKGETEGVTTTITIEGVTPPVPPVPPDPKPPVPPVPPDPPAPIPADGLHVLIVYERMEAAKLSRDQFNCIYGQEFYAYLDSRCPLGPDKRSRTWRIWDKDVQVSADESPVWSAAMKRDRKTLPWIVVSNGKTGFEGELPKSKDEIMALLKKYGG